MGGIGPSLIPSGNIEADMQIIHDFYANVSGKYMDKTDLEAITLTEGSLKQRTRKIGA